NAPSHVPDEIDARQRDKLGRAAGYGGSSLSDSRCQTARRIARRRGAMRRSGRALGARGFARSLRRARSNLRTFFSLPLSLISSPSTSFLLGPLRRRLAPMSEDRWNIVPSRSVVKLNMQYALKILASRSMPLICRQNPGSPAGGKADADQE